MTGTDRCAECGKTLVFDDVLATEPKAHKADILLTQRNQFGRHITVGYSRACGTEPVCQMESLCPKCHYDDTTLAKRGWL